MNKRKRIFLCLFSIAVFAVFESAVFGADLRFTDNKNNTVSDHATSLVWIQDTSKVPVLQGSMIWIQAVNVCRNLDYGGSGVGSWRLPNIDELQTLISEDIRTPRINSVFKAVSGPYWSNTGCSGEGAKAWVVDFKDGSLLSYAKLSLLKPSKCHTRCVRNL